MLYDWGDQSEHLAAWGWNRVSTETDTCICESQSHGDRRVWGFIVNPGVHNGHKQVVIMKVDILGRAFTEVLAVVSRYTQSKAISGQQI